MSRAELDRLASDLVADPALARRLASALQPDADQATAAAALQDAGYRIEAAELPGLTPLPQPLGATALDRVTGGVAGWTRAFRNTISPFDDQPG